MKNNVYRKNNNNWLHYTCKYCTVLNFPYRLTRIFGLHIICQSFDFESTKCESMCKFSKKKKKSRII